MKELIQIELDSDTPDWLKIAKMAENMYVSSHKRHDFLGIRENMFNLVKVGENNIRPVYDILKVIYPLKSSKILMVGGYGANSLTVTQAVKILKVIENGIIVCCKDALIKHLSEKPYMTFNTSIKRNNFTREKTYVWKNIDESETVQFTEENIVSLMRDYKLKSLID